MGCAIDIDRPVAELLEEGFTEAEIVDAIQGDLKLPGRLEAQFVFDLAVGRTTGDTPIVYEDE